ncbi:MAG: hypothetical protein QNJ40_18390 [Xanthomonadales bacterium]|nr:hypothetical protein [Xanthomonadales bacterium]
MSAFFAQALPVIWLFFSWHLIVLSIPLLWASIAKPAWFLQAAFFCGLVALGDFFWVYSVTGWFPGTVLLSIVVASLAVTTMILFQAKRASAT